MWAFLSITEFNGNNRKNMVCNTHGYFSTIRQIIVNRRKILKEKARDLTFKLTEDERKKY